MTAFNKGDHVYIYSSGYQALSRGVIARVTKTQAIIQHERYEQKFNRETGRLIGGGTWNSTSIAHPNDRLDREWREQQVRTARRLLSKAAETDDPNAIRAAYEKWDRLDKENADG